MADGTIKILTDLDASGFQKGISKLGSIASTGLKATTAAIAAAGGAIAGLLGASAQDKEQLLFQEIQLLTIRERRMLKRIENLRQADFTTVKKKKGTEKDKWTDLDEKHATLAQIQNIEDALTRVQARKQAAIDSLHRYGVDDARLEIELMKLDMAALKLGGQDTEVEEDGFLEALNAETRELWGNTDDD